MSNFGKPVITQVATNGELRKCPDMILCRYNGHPGSDLSPGVLAARGADYQFYGKNAAGVVVSGWPVYVRANRYVAIPDLPENHKILKSFKPQRMQVRKGSGNTTSVSEAPYPPLYEIVSEEVVQVSQEQVIEIFKNMSPELRTQLLTGLTEPAPAPAEPRNTDADDLRRVLEEDRASLAEAEGVLASESSTKAEKKAAEARKADLEQSIEKWSRALTETVAG